MTLFLCDKSHRFHFLGFVHNNEKVENCLAKMLKEKVCAIIQLQGRTTATGRRNCLPVNMEECIMVRQVKVSSFSEVQEIVSAAARCNNDVGVHDMKGSIADAKSILGMMCLDYSNPVNIVCEDANDMNCVVRAIRQ